MFILLCVPTVVLILCLKTTRRALLCLCINCSTYTVCLFVESQGNRETIVVQNHLCNYEYFQGKLDHEEYSFSPDGDTTFLVYVYGFKTPFCLTVRICSSYHKWSKQRWLHHFSCKHKQQKIVKKEKNVLYILIRSLSPLFQHQGRNKIYYNIYM